MAYKVSEKYNEVIYSGDAKHKLKLLFNGVEYETANVKTEYVKIKDNILSNGEERFSLDNFVSKEAEIIIHDIELSDIVSPVSISIGTLVDTEYEYVPIGIFNIQETPTTDNGKTTIKLRDNSVKFDYPYDASEIIEKNGGSVTILALLQDICTKFSVELGTTDFANKDTTISVWDNTINARQYIMYIAEKAGCIAKIDRQGKLILADINKGEDITITSSSKSLQPQNNLSRPLSQLKIQGKSEQETRSGKNLFNKYGDFNYGNTNYKTSLNDKEQIVSTSNYYMQRSAGVLIENLKSNTDYSISGILVSANGTYGNNANIDIRGVSGTSNSALKVVQFASTLTKPYSFGETFNTGEYTSIWVSFNGHNSDSTGVTETIFDKIQLEEGEATEYEAFGVMPSPDYPSEIKSVEGIENLFDGELELGTLTPTGETSSNSNALRTKEFIKVEPNTTYTIKNDKNYYNYVYEYNNEKTFVKRQNAIQGAMTFTTSDTTEYIKFRTNAGTVENDLTTLFILVEGTIAHPYVPYGRYLKIDNSSKNILNITPEVREANGLTFTKNEDGSITINGTSTAGTFCNINTSYTDTTLKQFFTIEKGKTYTSYLKNNVPGLSMTTRTQSQNTNLFVITSGKEISTKQYTGETDEKAFTYLYVSSGTTFNNLTVYPMIVEGEYTLDTIGEYESYRSDVTYVNLAKEDLLDKENANILNAYFGSNEGVSVITSSGNNRTLYIPCEPNTTYTVVKSLSNQFRVGTTNELPASGVAFYNDVGGSRGVWNKNKKVSVTITTDENAQYLIVRYCNINNDSTTTPDEILSTIRIYKGSSSKDYYDLCSINDVEDEYEVVSGKGVKRINEVVLDGSENWVLNTSASNSNGYYEFQLKINDKPNKQVGLLCNRFQVGTSYDNSKEQIRNRTDYDIYINILGSRLESQDVTGFKKWLSNNPITVKYELATPEEFTLEPKQIKLFENTNNISLIEEVETELEATYSGKKEHIQIPVNLLESYKVGDKLKISRVVYEDAIRKFEYGTEKDETLYVNSANPYITDSNEIEKVFENINGYELYSLSTGKIIGNPALDSDDIIEFTYNDETYYTLSQNELTYNGVLIQKFNTQVGTKEKTQENVTINTEDSKYKRIFTRINQVEGNIELNTSQITNVQSDLKDNYYTIEQANQLIQNAETGVTNTFSEAGGNNIFRNTGLWFEQNDSNNPYEFWQGIVVRTPEERASNSNALLLQSGSLIQEQTVPNGKYTISFKYKKVIQLSNIKVKINDVITELTGIEETEFVQNIEVNSNHINIEFICDTNNGCEIYDLMVNAGSVKLAYSQNQNETTTDTVNISKGITIVSTDTDTTFKANADGIRTFDKNNNRLTEFTDTGMITKKQVVEDEAEIVGVLVQRVGNQTWFTKI